MIAKTVNKLFLSQILFSFFSGSAPGQAADKTPNFVFIFADDLGWSDLGCYGHPYVQTPHLDRLAKEGTLFAQFYVNGAVCSPSRAAFLTGRFPSRDRIHGAVRNSHEGNLSHGIADYLDPEVPTVARLLQDAGYATAMYGKWHLGRVPQAPTVDKYGFDDVRTVSCPDDGRLNGYWEGGPDFVVRSSGLFVDEAIRFITEHKDRPFYVNVWMLVPHATLDPTEEQMEPYSAFQPAANVKHKSAAQIYFGAITDMDRQIGRLLEALDELGLSQNTVVLFSSDNGPEDISIKGAGHSGVGKAGPFRGRKRSLYEGGIRVPAIVRWPGNIPAAKINDTTVVSGVDWLPTVCKLAEVQLPENAELDGEDMSDVFLGSSRRRTTPLMWEWRFRIMGDAFHHSPMLAIRDGDWKLLMNPDGSRTELYHIGSGEVNDLMEIDNQVEKQPLIVERLREKVLAWQQKLPPGPADPGAGERLFPWPGARLHGGTNIFYLSYPGVKNRNIISYKDLMRERHATAD